MAGPGALLARGAGGSVVARDRGWVRSPARAVTVGSLQMTGLAVAAYPMRAGWLAVAAMPLTALGAHLLTTEATEVRAVVALDRWTGRVQWIREVSETARGPQHLYNSAATPTPVVTRDTVFAYFGSAGLVAITRHGQVLWKNTDLPYKSEFGVGGSLAEHSGVVPRNRARGLRFPLPDPWGGRIARRTSAGPRVIQTSATRWST